MKSYMDGYVILKQEEVDGYLKEIRLLKNKLVMLTEDLRQCSQENDDCNYCLNSGKVNSWENISECEDNEYDCFECMSENCPCAGCRKKSRFVWRGEEG